MERLLDALKPIPEIEVVGIVVDGSLNLDENNRNSSNDYVVVTTNGVDFYRFDVSDSVQVREKSKALPFIAPNEQVFFSFRNGGIYWELRAPWMFALQYVAQYETEHCVIASGREYPKHQFYDNKYIDLNKQDSFFSRVKVSIWNGYAMCLHGEY